MRKVAGRIPLQAKWTSDTVISKNSFEDLIIINVFALVSLFSTASCTRHRPLLATRSPLCYLPASSTRTCGSVSKSSSRESASIGHYHSSKTINQAPREPSGRDANISLRKWWLHLSISPQYWQQSSAPPSSSWASSNWDPAQAYPINEKSDAVGA